MKENNLSREKVGKLRGLGIISIVGTTEQLPNMAFPYLCSLGSEIRINYGGIDDPLTLCYLFKLCTVQCPVSDANPSRTFGGVSDTKMSEEPA